MKLYTVKFALDLVVWAADETQAEAIGRKEENMERVFAQLDSVVPLIDSNYLPPGWNAGCLPYGRGDDSTIGQIIGYPAPANFEEGDA